MFQAHYPDGFEPKSSRQVFITWWQAQSRISTLSKRFLIGTLTIAGHCENGDIERDKSACDFVPKPVTSSNAVLIGTQAGTKSRRA
jgi:hypothetical protein